jgi:transcriptional regulator with XRE-family HTH domain
VKVVSLNVELVKQRQKALSLTQKQVAERARVEESTLSRWMNGKNSPTLDMMGGLPEALDVDLGDLILVDGVRLSEATKKRLLARLSEQVEEAPTVDLRRSPEAPNVEEPDLPPPSGGAGSAADAPMTVRRRAKKASPRH